MNEFTFTLAILVRKDIITLLEAKALQKARNEGVLSSNLGEMITKVDSALAKKVGELETVDASKLFNKG
jgi:hypothetical protein